MLSTYTLLNNTDISTWTVFPKVTPIVIEYELPSLASVLLLSKYFGNRPPIEIMSERLERRVFKAVNA